MPSTLTRGARDLIRDPAVTARRKRSMVSPELIDIRTPSTVKIPRPRTGISDGVRWPCAIVAP